jgi:hypothetical protein
MAVLEEVSKYKLDLLEYRRSYGRSVAPNQQASVHFSTERELKSWIRCIRESYEQLRRLGLLVIRCHT